MSSSLGGLWWWNSNSSGSGSGSGTDSGSKSGSGSKSPTSGTGGSSGPASATGSAASGGGAGSSGTGSAGAPETGGSYTNPTTDPVDPVDRIDYVKVQCPATTDPTYGAVVPTDEGVVLEKPCLGNLVGKRTATCKADGAWEFSDKACMCPATANGYPSTPFGADAKRPCDGPPTFFGGETKGTCTLTGFYEGPTSKSECWTKSERCLYYDNLISHTKMWGQNASQYEKDYAAFKNAYGCT